MVWLSQKFDDDEMNRTGQNNRLFIKWNQICKKRNMKPLFDSSLQSIII